MNVLALAGSLRKDSYNKRLLHASIEIAKDLDASVELFDLQEANIPVFDADLEAKGIPESVKTFRSAIQNAEVLIIASPEYNRSVPGGLKNAIDWASRKPNVLDGKVAAVLGASPGRFGTVRAQLHLKPILNALNVLVTPSPEVYVSNVSDDTFAKDGTLADSSLEVMVKDLISNTITIANKLL